MTPSIAAQIVTIYRRAAGQHPEWTQKQLLEAVCFRCYALHQLELECEDVTAALDMVARTAASDGGATQIGDMIPTGGA